MTYQQLFDEVIGDAPVCTVDVERVIGRQRRVRRLRMGAAGTAVAGAVLALVLGVTSLVATPRSADPAPPAATPTPSPTITTVAGTPEDWARIDAAIVAALSREAPGLETAGPNGPLSGWSRQGGEEGQTTLTGYWGQGGIGGGISAGHFSVQIDRDGATVWKIMNKAPCVSRGITIQCTERAGPGGELARLRSSVAEFQMPAKHGARPVRHEQVEVQVLRADGSLVSANASAPNGRPPLTPEQALAVARDPGVALAPLR